MPGLLTTPQDRTLNAISPAVEMGAYEYLWQLPSERAAPVPSFKSIAALFRKHPGALPSDLVEPERAAKAASDVFRYFEERNVGPFGVRIWGSAQYPEPLRDAEHPLAFLYYQGWWDLAESPKRIAIVGTRKPSDEGVRRAKKLVRSLVKDNFVIVSGLATGIDTIAHETAIDEGGQTIAVIGTPISETYPKENVDLQQRIARDYLLISQVPVLRYRQQSYMGNRLFFPERNITMSALTAATVIIEAGATSGTLIQARAALAQGRKLFILESNFTVPGLEWPHRFAELGANRVKDYDDIGEALDGASAAD
jgi:DNA processing protein